MAVSVNKNLAASYILEDPLGRIANDGRVSNLGRVGKKGYVDSRFAPNFDGVDDYGVLATRAINPDGDNSFEFWTPSALTSTPYFIISQNNQSAFSQREFSLAWSGIDLGFVFGGQGQQVLTVAQGLKPSTLYGLTLIGNNFRILEGGLNGTLIRTASFVRGTAREPTAPTRIGVRGNDGGGVAGFYLGLQYNIRINGILWPMADRNQAIQLPEPSGLGAELITPTALENPAVKGSQWTYLGGGRWQYVGDGSFNALEPLSTAATPTAGYLEFEVESISGQMSCTRGNLTRGRFSSVGVFRYFYTDINEGGTNNAAIRFTRATNGQVVSCIIKNISFKPLGTCNPMTLVNVTSDSWQEVAQ